MDFTSLMIAVSASGAAGVIFLLAFIVYYGLWHDFRRLDKEPTWLTARLLLSCGVLRMKGDDEIIYKRSFAENCIVLTAVCYIILGLLNFGAGVYSIVLLDNVQDSTCQYAVDMGSRCASPTCSTPCGGHTFSSCGHVACDPLRCSADISAFLLLSNDAASASAASCFSTLSGQLTVVQAIFHPFTRPSCHLQAFYAVCRCPSVHSSSSRPSSVRAPLHNPMPNNPDTGSSRKTNSRLADRIPPSQRHGGMGVGWGGAHGPKRTRPAPRPRQPAAPILGTAASPRRRRFESGLNTRHPELGRGFRSRNL